MLMHHIFGIIDCQLFLSERDVYCIFFVVAALVVVVFGEHTHTYAYALDVKHTYDYTLDI
ncbi:hypothetical protein N0V86_008204 [Didymella sp. IMI 355093]|nr:hypothetical protein N0V86_008204 [Didymella sp. IMI 355093]